VTVYVDDMYLSPMGEFGRMKMSHLIADTDDELHAMAARIGVARKWHQAPPRHTSHYDIAISKRTLALRYGAVAITWRQFGGMAHRRDATGLLGSPHDAEEWLAEWMAARRYRRDYFELFGEYPV